MDRRMIVAVMALAVSSSWLPAAVAHRDHGDLLEVGRRCRVVLDGSGDAPNPLAPSLGESDDVLDIVATDMATESRSLQVVLRLAELDQLAQPGRADSHFYVWFDVAESRFGLRARVGVQGTLFDLVVPDASLTGTTAAASSTVVARVEGKLDLRNEEIAISAPFSAFKAHRTVMNGQSVHNIQVRTWYGADVLTAAPSAAVAIDDAAGQRRYTVGTRRCADS